MTSGGNSINDFPENQLSKPIPASIQYAATANAVYNGQALLQSVNQFIRQQSINSAGLMPTEARGNYLPEPPYLLETKTYHSPPVESTRYDLLAIISSRYQYGPFLFFLLQKLCQITWLLPGWKKFSLLPEAPLKLVAVATSATWLIRHWGPTATYKSQCTIYSDYSPRQCKQYI